MLYPCFFFFFSPQEIVTLWSSLKTDKICDCFICKECTTAKDTLQDEQLGWKWSWTTSQCHHTKTTKQPGQQLVTLPDFKPTMSLTKAYIRIPALKNNNNNITNYIKCIIKHIIIADRGKKAHKRHITGADKKHNRVSNLIITLRNKLI
jgi:hypothetical protein